MSTSLDQQLRELRNAILNRPPYFSGTVPVHKDELVVYYSKGEVEEARYVSALSQSRNVFTPWI